MNRLFLLLLVMAGFMAGATERKKDFTLTLIPPKDLEAKRFFLDREVDHQLVRDSGELVNDVVKFKGITEFPVKARILILKPDENIEFIEVLLEAANITVDASKGLYDVLYSGSPVQETFNEWKAIEGPIMKKVIATWGSVTAAVEKGDKEAEQKARAETMELFRELNTAQQKFLLANGQSLAAALMLHDFVTPVWENVETAEIIYNGLPEEIKSLPDMQKFGKELAIAKKLGKGQSFPEISLPDSTGKMISTSSFKGKYVLVDFWASWCGPCRAESPALRQAYASYKDKGFDIFSISLDQNKKAWLHAVVKDGYVWPNVADLTGMGPQGKISSQYNIMAIPRNFLLDPEGKIIATNLRGGALEEKLKEVFGN